MILLQTDDVEQHKSRVESAGMRVVHDGEIKQHGAAIRVFTYTPRMWVVPFCRWIKHSRRKAGCGQVTIGSITRWMAW